jgi:hypothetical protein
LKEIGYAESLYAGIEKEFVNEQLFSIQINMTSEGESKKTINK